jgi:hypothetical protein
MIQLLSGYQIDVNIRTEEVSDKEGATETETAAGVPLPEATLSAKEGFTALHVATATGHIGAVKAILKMQPDVNLVDNGGRTPLHWGAKNKRLEIVQQLLGVGATPKTVDKEGKTALMCVLFFPFTLSLIVPLLCSVFFSRDFVPLVTAECNHEEQQQV